MFKTLADAVKVHGEVRCLDFINMHLKNMEYRKGYNKRNNEFKKVLANDPVVAKRLAELKAKAAK